MAAAGVAVDATLSWFSLRVCVAATLQELEKLEVERIEWIQQHLRQYTTLRHETDMFNQSVSRRGRSPAMSLAPPPPQLLLLSCQVVEPVDQLLQKVDPGKDRELWVTENKTGEVRPVDMDI